MRERLTIASAIWVMSIVVPQVASAGIIDVIWEMSGPRMVGAGLVCRYSVVGEFKLQGCRIEARKVTLRDDQLAKPWLDIGGSIYVSVPHNGFGYGDAWMVAGEPVLDVPWRIKGKWTVYTGAGGTFDYLWGRRDSANFDHFSFGNAGLKFIPIGVEKKSNGINIQAIARLYPDEFGQDRFDGRPSAIGNRPHEFIYGATVGFPIKGW